LRKRLIERPALEGRERREAKIKGMEAAKGQLDHCWVGTCDLRKKGGGGKRVKRGKKRGQTLYGGESLGHRDR